jgi:hypothetical protein
MPAAGAQLVQILLPLRDPAGRPFPRAELDAVREELTERFGGVTAYLQAPASGAWEDAGRVERDEVVLVEVMVERLEPEWWRAYRHALEVRFAQDELVVRALPMERI